jgi:hypothetical protein
VLLILAVAVQGLDADAFLHPRLAAGTEAIRAVVLLQATAEMKAQGPRRYDFKEKEGELLASAVTPVVSGALKKRGWEVDDRALATQNLADNELVRWQVNAIRERHHALLARIKPKDVRKGRYSLGAGVSTLGSWPQGTVLALVHAEGARRTTGAQTMDWIFVPLTALTGGLTGFFVPPDMKTMALHISFR